MMPSAKENSSRSNRSLSRPSSRNKRSGYEPSDTETEWQESPWHEGRLVSNRSKTPDPVRIISSLSNRSKTPDPTRTISPMYRSQRHTSREHNDNSANKASRTSPGITRHSRSPYKPTRHGEDGAAYTPASGLRRNTSYKEHRYTSPFEAPEHRKTSPLKVSEHRNTSPLNVPEHRNTSPLKMSEHRNTSPFKASEHGKTSPLKASEYRKTSPFKGSEHRNTSSFKVSEYRSKHVSPYRVRREETNHETDEHDGSSRKRNQRTPTKHQQSEDKGAHLQPQEGPSTGQGSHKELQEVSRISERSNDNQSRSTSASKARAREIDQQATSSAPAPGAERRPSPLAKTIIHPERDNAYAENHTPKDINEQIANIKLAKSPSADVLLMESTDSVSLGDIFVSHVCTASQKESSMKNSDKGNKFHQQYKAYPKNNNIVHHSRSSSQNPQIVSVSTVLSQTNTNSTSAFGRLSNGRSSSYSSKFSDSSSKMSGSFKKISAIRQKSQTDTWLSCVRRGGSCTKTKSPDSRAIDEASFIERALVVEELRPFWADKHSPHSLSKFICQKQQARHLKQLVTITSLYFWFFIM